MSYASVSFHGVTKVDLKERPASDGHGGWITLTFIDGNEQTLEVIVYAKDTAAIVAQLADKGLTHAYAEGRKDQRAEMAMATVMEVA